MSMTGKFGKAVLTLLMLAGLVLPTAATGGAAPAAASDQLTASQVSMEPYYFSETGHYLSGRFRQYSESTPNALYVFGFPLTKVYMERSTDGQMYMTQYFERARFEYHPENNQPYDVLLTLLGNEITAQRGAEQEFQRVGPQDFGDAAQGCQGYSPETGHNVYGIICRFWNNFGGLQNFGYPTSERFFEVNQENGQTYEVQYFERNRFEIHPEYEGSQYEVLLGFLGKERMNRIGVRADVRAPETRAEPERDPRVQRGRGDLPAEVESHRVRLQRLPGRQPQRRRLQQPDAGQDHRGRLRLDPLPAGVEGLRAVPGRLPVVDVGHAGKRGAGGRREGVD